MNSTHFASNLPIGRRWPPHPDDLEEAEGVRLAALDPGTLRSTIGYLFEWAPSMLMVAHP